MEKSLFFVVLGGKLGHIQVVPWQTKRILVIRNSLSGNPGKTPCYFFIISQKQEKSTIFLLGGRYVESPLPIQSRFLSGVFLLNCREKCAFRSFQIHPGTGSTACCLYRISCRMWQCV